MLWFCLVLSLFVPTFSTQAEEDGPPSLVNLTDQPIARVHGTVNVITGDWVDQDIHEQPSGPDVYPIGHAYTTSSYGEGNLSDSWNFLWPSVLEYTITIPHLPDGSPVPNIPPIVRGQTYPPSQNTFMVLHEAGGARLPFTYSPQYSCFVSAFCCSGYTHISSIDHPVACDSSRTAIRKATLQGYSWTVTLSDGTERYFSQRKAPGTYQLFRNTKNKFYYNLTKEVLPSKNIRYFLYDKKGDLVAIKTWSSCQKYLIQQISLKTTKEEIVAKSLDNHEVVFEMAQVKNHIHKKLPFYFVKSIRCRTTPRRQYLYDENSYSSRIKGRTWETGLVEEAYFYKGSETVINGEKVHVPKDDRDFTNRRVSEIRTKRFRGEKPFMKHGFYYDKKDHNGEWRILSALDADGSKTRYMWNPEDRIIWTTYFDPKDQPLAKEHFVWGDYSDQGRLILRAFYDEKKNPLFVRTWDFSKKGFPQKECWHGLFTRYDIQELTLKDKTQPKGGETLTIQATWDEQGRQKSRLDQEGNLVEMEYDRSFLSARYTYYKQARIIKREFYEYDTAGSLIHLSSDDGTTKDRKSLKGVTRQYSTTIEPRREAPHFGEPLKKVHKIWTPSLGYRRILTEYFTRDSSGKVLSHKEHFYDGLEKVTSYRYDSSDRIVETILPDKTFERCSYDPISGLITEKTYPSKKVLYTYDLCSRLISEKEVFPDSSSLETTIDYDESGRRTTVRDTHGSKTVVEKDLLGRVVLKKFPKVMTAHGSVVPIETRRYEGRSVFVTSPSGAVTETIYSSFGKPLLIKHPEGYSTTYTYDLLGRLVESFDGNLRQTIAYDERGHIKRQETWAGSERVDWQVHRYQGDDLSQTITKLLIIKMKYDLLGRCIKKRTIDRTNQKEIVEKISFDSLGRVICTKSHDVVQRFVYDTHGHLVETTKEGLDGKMLLHTKNQYDGAGRLIESSIERDESTWLTTRTTYGAFGLASFIEAPDGSRTQFVYELAHSKWSKKTIDPRGVVTEELFMGGSAPIAQSIRDPFGSIISSQRTYICLLGKPEKIEYDIYYNGQKEETLTTLLDYDAFGRCIRIREAAGTNEEVSSYKSYDSYNRLVEETLLSGIHIDLSYDQKGHLVHKKSSDGTIDYTFSYTYHDCIAKVEDLVHSTSTTRTYDGFKHMLTETQSNGLALNYSYTNGGLLESVLLPDSSKVSYTFHNGLLQEASRTTPKETYSFSVTKRNRAGMILETSLPLNGGTVTYSYDLQNHVLAKEQQKASESRTFDQIGRVDSRTIDGVTEHFKYDFLSEIISDNGQERSYDSLYRLRSRDGESTTVTRRQQLTKLNDKTFSFDLDGRRIRDGEAHLSYDALGRLISYEKDGQWERYEYDGFSRRMSKTTPLGTERYLWMGQQEVGTFDQDMHPVSFRLIAEGVGSEGGATIAIELSGIPYVAFSDLSGNIRSLVSASGTEVHTASYSSFSRTLTTGLECPWGFFSKRHDALSSYVMFVYRLYDQETGSWISQDPLGLEGGPNLYAYVKNNPLSRFDALGLFDCGSFFDSCCDFVSDCCRAVSDAVSSACSAVRDSISSACSAVSDWASSCASEIGHSVQRGLLEVSNGIHHAISSCLYTQRELSLQADRPTYSMMYGGVIDENTKMPAGLYFFPYGPKKEFLQAAQQDPEMWGKVIKPILADGMETSFFTCCQRAAAAMSGPKDYVMMLYNPDAFFIEAAGRATANALSISDPVVRIFHDDLFDVLLAAETAGHTGFSPQCHSQGAAIMDCLLHTPEFDPKMRESYFHCFSQIYTYGGATFITDGVNYVAPFDMVPFLNPRNWMTMIVSPECVHFTSFVIQSPLRAHGFDNPSYQSVYQEVIRSFRK